MNGDHVQINQVSPDRHHVDGKVWLQDAGTYTVLRLDVATGTFEVFEPVQDPAPQRLRRDPRFTEQRILPGDGRGGGGADRREDRQDQDLQDADARVGAAARHDGRAGSPLVRREPRRQDRDVRYAESATFKEWAAPTPGAWPYDVTIDRNGEAWSGGEYNDRILRLNPATGEFIEYLLPRQTNVRRVFVDNSTTPVTFWVGNNHGASIVKLEPLD